MYSIKDCANQMPAVMQGSGAIVGRAADQCEKLEPKRLPEMQAVLRTLEERLSMLEKEQSGLRERLSVILRSEPPQAQNSSTPEYSGSTPLTSAIAQATNRINGLIFQTRTMLDLLEL